MAGIVKPIGPIDQRLAVKHLGHFLCGLPVEMLLGNGAGNIVPLLSPGGSIERKSREGNAQTEGFYHILHKNTILLKTTKF